MDDRCPICGDPRKVGNEGRLRATCGKTACHRELAARQMRGRPGGHIPSHPTTREGLSVSYTALHARVRRALRGQPCAHADSTCSGGIEVALRSDADPAFLRRDDDGRLYFVGPPAEGYMPLCRSHHNRHDRLGQLAQRNPVIGRALRAEDVRRLHAGHADSGCAGCAALAQYDEALAALLAS